ncbi:MAG: DNA polymerase III subunit delta [Ktedonobacteraceae bacterium]
MFYLFHGDDEFTCREQVKKLRQSGNFEYNQDTYNGADVDLTTITTTTDTMPFLTEQRLVLVEGLPKRKRGETAVTEASTPSAETSTKIGKGKKGKKSKSIVLTRAGFEKALAEHVPSMPDTTVLILLVDEVIDAANPLVKAAEKHGKVIQCTLPKGTALENWITKRAKNSGVKVSSEATALLANYIGNHLRLLANEIDKLATYVGEGKTIDAADVRKLSAQVQEARIFDLTDALAQRNRKQALNILHDLLSDGEPPIKLISTITSQVRSLLLVKELSQKGMRSSAIASTIGMAPFIAEKALRQVGNFSMPQLEGAYRQLLSTDAALKRSRIEPEMALDLLVVTFGVI